MLASMPSTEQASERASTIVAVACVPKIPLFSNTDEVNGDHYLMKNNERETRGGATFSRLKSEMNVTKAKHANRHVSQ